jgi:hypothetical protein
VPPRSIRFEIKVEALDALAERARSTLKEALREKAFREYFQIVVDQGYSIVYLHLEDLVAYDLRRVRDVDMSRYIDPNLREVKLRHSPTQPRAD